MANPLDISALFSVKNLVAVVTGGGTGIGLMVARALDANGASAVYIVGRREEVLQSAAKQAVNGNIVPFVGDVTSQSSLASIASHVGRPRRALVPFLSCRFKTVTVSFLASFIHDILFQDLQGLGLVIILT